MDNSSARDRPATLVLYDAFSDSIKRFLSWLEESMTSLEETLSDESIQMECTVIYKAWPGLGVEY